jgi:alkanesulfonate monooxygenase SsuD/methylene tetrahydromethanopterin reductase-like flavin-dependent oxidoreductase (luciferase family)
MSAASRTVGGCHQTRQTEEDDVPDRDLKLGILLWSQAATWPEMLDAAKRVDRLGYAHLWTWDHLYAIFGDPYQPIFEGWSTLAAWAMATEQTRLGLLVGANTFRNPGLVAKTATTLDHISGGRAILGIGGAWMAPEHSAHGIDFGSGFGQRLDWLDESVGAMRQVLDGESVTSAPGGRYAFDDLRHQPATVQAKMPIMIGGSGEKKTLRTVARYADMWNAMGPVELMRHKIDVLNEHCAAVGRDPSEIEFTLGVKVTIRDTHAEAERVCREALAYNKTPLSEVEDDDTFWNGTPEELADRLRPYVEMGFRTVISEQPNPYDVESLERFIGEVKPLIDAG